MSEVEKTELRLERNVMTQPVYLLVAGGDNIRTTLALEDGLERAFLELHFSSIDDKDSDLHEDVLSGLRDDDSWEMAEPPPGGAGGVRTRYFCNYEDGYVEVIRLPDDWQYIPHAVTQKP
jgi:hypothetical protein